MKKNNSFSTEVEQIAKARMAACVAEIVMGKRGMDIVKKSLNRLSFDDVIALWAGVDSLLRGNQWTAGFRYPVALRQTAHFLAAVILTLPWPSHEEMVAKLSKNSKSSKS